MKYGKVADVFWVTADEDAVKITAALANIAEKLLKKKISNQSREDR